MEFWSNGVLLKDGARPTVQGIEHRAERIACKAESQELAVAEYAMPYAPCAMLFTFCLLSSVLCLLF